MVTSVMTRNTVQVNSQEVAGNVNVVLIALVLVGDDKRRLAHEKTGGSAGSAVHGSCRQHVADQHVVGNIRL